LGFSVDLVVGISCASEVVFGAGDDVSYCVVGGCKYLSCGVFGDGFPTDVVEEGLGGVGGSGDCVFLLGKDEVA
jgi:hypothetical protein